MILPERYSACSSSTCVHKDECARHDTEGANMEIYDDGVLVCAFYIPFRNA